MISEVARSLSHGKGNVNEKASPTTLMNAQSWDVGQQRDMARPERMLLPYFEKKDLTL